MKKLTLSAAAAALLLSSVAFAMAKDQAPGASGTSPGHEMQKHGSKKGHPGASGYAPGHEQKR
jgi:opacity protein-like surface antigen